MSQVLSQTSVRRFIFGFGWHFAGSFFWCNACTRRRRFHLKWQSGKYPESHGMYPCIYYDTGKGFSDDEEVRLDYQNRPLNEFQTYEATLPTLMPILHLRMDPLQLPGVVALCNLTIGRYRVVKVDRRRFSATSFYRNGVAVSFEGQTLIAHLWR